MSTLLTYACLSLFPRRAESHSWVLLGQGFQTRPTEGTQMSRKCQELIWKVMLPEGGRIFAFRWPRAMSQFSRGDGEAALVNLTQLVVSIKKITIWQHIMEMIMRFCICTRIHVSHKSSTAFSHFTHGNSAANVQYTTKQFIKERPG